ncbi:MAG: hypothetical protein ACYS5V_06595 [Planctomycetota bacterium]|jgi:hypothetical protein
MASLHTYPVNRYLDTVGDGTGTKNAVGDYSGASAEQFYIQCPAAGGSNLVLTRMIIGIEDTTGMKPELYGAAAALGNGIQVKVIDADGTTVISDLTDGVPIKTNTQWGFLCYDVAEHNWGNTPDDEMFLVRWTFARSGTDITLKPSHQPLLHGSGLLDYAEGLAWQTRPSTPPRPTQACPSTR